MTRNAFYILLLRPPVNHGVEHGVYYGQHLGHAGEVILVRTELFLQGRDPLHDVQHEPSA